MKPYTVIGIYADNDQPFAFYVEASDPEQAKHRAHIQAESELLIAGVVEGYQEVA